MSVSWDGISCSKLFAWHLPLRPELQPRSTNVRCCNDLIFAYKHSNPLFQQWWALICCWSFIYNSKSPDMFLFNIKTGNIARYRVSGCIAKRYGGWSKFGVWSLANSPLLVGHLLNRKLWINTGPTFVNQRRCRLQNSARADVLMRRSGTD